MITDLILRSICGALYPNYARNLEEEHCFLPTPLNNPKTPKPLTLNPLILNNP